MRNFGYIESPYDSRDIIFAGGKTEEERYILENMPGVVDQGVNPTCAAITLSTMINWQKFIKEDKVKLKYEDIYDLRADEDMQGMVPRQALSALKNKGVDGYKIKSYARVDTIEDAKFAILINGPLLAGFIAYSGDAFWKPVGPELGGHAVTLYGFSKNGFMIQNSWGTGWMNGGRGVLPYEDWERVLECWTINL